MDFRLRKTGPPFARLGLFLLLILQTSHKEINLGGYLLFLKRLGGVSGWMETIAQQSTTTTAAYHFLHLSLGVLSFEVSAPPPSLSIGNSIMIEVVYYIKMRERERRILWLFWACVGEILPRSLRCLPFPLGSNGWVREVSQSAGHSNGLLSSKSMACGHLGVPASGGKGSQLTPPEPSVMSQPVVMPGRGGRLVASCGSCGQGRPRDGGEKHVGHHALSRHRRKEPTERLERTKIFPVSLCG